MSGIYLAAAKLLAVEEPRPLIESVPDRGNSVSFDGLATRLCSELDDRAVIDTHNLSEPVRTLSTGLGLFELGGFKAEGGRLYRVAIRPRDGLCSMMETEANGLKMSIEGDPPGIALLMADYALSFPNKAGLPLAAGTDRTRALGILETLAMAGKADVGGEAGAQSQETTTVSEGDKPPVTTMPEGTAITARLDLPWLASPQSFTREFPGACKILTGTTVCSISPRAPVDCLTALKCHSAKYVYKDGQLVRTRMLIPMDAWNFELTLANAMIGHPIIIEQTIPEDSCAAHRAWVFEASDSYERLTSGLCYTGKNLGDTSDGVLEISGKDIGHGDAGPLPTRS